MVDMSYTTSGRESRNMYTFVASSEDNGARFRCEAKNEQIVQPMKTEILLKVQCKLFFYDDQNGRFQNRAKSDNLGKVG